MTVELIFNSEGGKCYKLQTFYRRCGHIETSYLHTNLCMKNVADQLTPQRRTGQRLCWCPFTLGLHRAYCVGQCRVCQEAEEGDLRRPGEPWTTAQRGLDSSIDSEVRYSKDQITQRALVARKDIEKQNRRVRTQILQEERAEQARKLAREQAWNLEWTRHISSPVPRARLLDLQWDFSGPRTANDLLELAPLEGSDGIQVGDSPCHCCFLPLSEPFTEGTANFAVRVIGGCGHGYHSECVYRQFVNNAARCPYCKAEYTYVLKNGLEDPKFRWIRFLQDSMVDHYPPHEFRQVAGYVSFAEGLAQSTSRRPGRFRAMDGDDPWGDKLCEVT